MGEEGAGGSHPGAFVSGQSRLQSWRGPYLVCRPHAAIRTAHAGQQGHLSVCEDEALLSSDNHLHPRLLERVFFVLDTKHIKNTTYSASS